VAFIATPRHPVEDIEFTGDTGLDPAS